MTTYTLSEIRNGTGFPKGAKFMIAPERATVYLVFYDSGSDRCDFVGAFSTLENAQSKIACYGPAEQECMTIEQHTLDDI